MSDQRERIKVLSAGIFSLILVLGVARFSYTPLLRAAQTISRLMGAPRR